MDFDTTPSMFTVTDVRILRGVAYMKGTNAYGEEYIASLDTHAYGPFVGPLTWWASTVEQKVKDNGSFRLMSVYDSEKDEWYCRAGNYSIMSKRLVWKRVDSDSQG